MKNSFIFTKRQFSSFRFVLLVEKSIASAEKNRRFLQQGDRDGRERQLV